MNRLGALLIVAAMLPVEAHAQLLDHLKCYRIDAPRRFRAIVDLESRLTGLEKGCRVGEPKLLCVPATKTVVKAQDVTGAPLDPLPVNGPEAGLRICYRVLCPDQKVPDLELVDQFGVLPLAVREASLLCTPAEECDPVCDSDADCDDGNECTQDGCGNPGSCTAHCASGFLHDTPCSAGVCCAGTCVAPVCTSNVDCDDGNECTQDGCGNPGTCAAVCASGLLHDTPCAGGVCCAGTCVPPVCSTNAECDDSNDCTVDGCGNPGTCAAVCTHGLLVDGTPCPGGVCCAAVCTPGQACGAP